MADDTPAPVQLEGPSRANADRLVPVLAGYLAEAKQGREGGLNPRDQKWEENFDLYWGRTDFSGKASWQAKEKMPEVPAFVDRFAAALKEALITGPEGFYTVHDPSDAEGDLTQPIKRATDAWLSTCGRNQTGTCLGFPAVFEEQCKLGAISAMCASVRWHNDGHYGRVAVETVDPRLVWLDTTYRNLYRIRRVELDKHTLVEMATMEDRKGRPIYNLDEIGRMVSHIESLDQQRRERATGDSQFLTSTRQPITMDEYIATAIGPRGEVLAKDALMVVGNGQFLIRGPEPNPYWHGKDWMVFAPLVTAPLSVYGRSYMEDFGDLARTFQKLTNMLLDAVQVSSMKVFAVVPEMLRDPSQLVDGLRPFKLFEIEDGFDAKEFMHALELGNLPAEAITVWQALKGELREAASMNEIGLGQFAPRGRTSATEIQETQQSSSALIRSIAQTIEGRFLNPILDLTWKTGLQHVSRTDPAIRGAIGEEMFEALYRRRRELIKRPITFQARGISTLIQKSRTLKALLQVMAFLGQSKELLAAFLQVADMEKFVKLLFDLSDVDLSKVSLSQRDKMIRGVMGQLQAAQQPAAPGTSGPPAPGAQAQAQAGGLA